MEEIIPINTVSDYAHYFGLADTDPLVGAIDLRKARNWPSQFRLTFGVYVVQLMGTHCGEIRYGRNQQYDFDAGTIIAYSPGQTIDVRVMPGEMPSARSIMFHPDYIRGTVLSDMLDCYSFFAYSTHEALYVSAEEQQMFVEVWQRIQAELARPADEFQREIVCMNIDLLLKHCARSYARQCDCRKVVNHDVLTQFEQLLHDYFSTRKSAQLGFPTVRYFADKVRLSPNYFGDLIKSLTGSTPRDIIHQRIIDEAKNRLSLQGESINEIAYALGFNAPQHFSRMFKSMTGQPPNAYRKARKNDVP